MDRQQWDRTPVIKFKHQTHCKAQSTGLLNWNFGPGSGGCKKCINFIQQLPKLLFMRLLPLLLFLGISTILQSQLPNTQPIILRDLMFHYPANYNADLDLYDQIRQIPDVGGNIYCWLQFYKPLTTRELNHLKNLNIQLTGYVKQHTYLAAIPTQTKGNPIKELPVRGIYPIEPSHRLSPALREALSDPKRQNEKTSLLISYFQNEGADMLEAELAKMRYILPIWQRKGHQLQITLPLKDISILAECAAIRYIENLPPPGEPEDRNGRAMHRSNLLHQSGTLPTMPYNGEGVNVLVRDDGQIGPHIDFLGRLNQDFSLRPPTDGTHGDMVSGIVCGANNLDPTVEGMASGAFLFTEDYDADFLGPTIDLVENHNVVITNTSYSDGCNDGNTIRTERVDAQIWSHPELMHVFSAGNAGISDCGYGAGPFWGNITGGHKAGKNSIATANLFADHSLANSSSRGPVFDGRIKPDLSAHGQEQLSTYPNHTILPGGGTSAAAPGIAGVMAQLYQVYKERNGGANPESALIKGAMLVTANDLGKPGPDFIYGWGLVNAFAAYKLLDEKRYERISLAQGQQKNITIDIPDGIAEARFMIYWADPAALPQASEALVNDLELKVFAPGNSTALLPLVLNHSPDPFLLNSPAKPGEDHLNNMEQVRMINPEVGSYEISINGLQLPFGETSAYLFYEFLMDEPTLVFPSGGEHLDPNSTITVYWDALNEGGNWDLEYSVDSGLTWVPVISLSDPSRRHYQLQLPDTITHAAFIRLWRDSIYTQNKQPFQLLGRPSDIIVTKACPDSIYISWDAVPEAEGYEVFIPGERYMEKIGDTDSTYYVLPTWNPLADNWFALRSRIGDQFYSERSFSVRHQLGLVGCKQTNDAKPDKVISPTALEVVACESGSLDILISIKNDGLEPIKDLPVYYQVGTAPAVQSMLSGLLNPGTIRFFKFSNPPLFTENGDIPLKIWTDLPNDQFRFNDTLSLTVKVYLQLKGELAPDFIEDFESVLDIPEKWDIINENNDGISWIVSRILYDELDSTNALVMPNFYYDQFGAKDFFLSPEIDLSKVWKPRLAFDLAYSGLFGFGPDSLYIQISTDCGSTIDKTVYAKTDTELITVPFPDFIAEPFVPLTATDWRTEEIDLSEFAGQRILIRFLHVAGYGNNLWIDNIQITEDGVNPLAGGFTVPYDSICTGVPTQLTDVSFGPPDTWSWDFGQDAVPATSTDKDPHAVSWSSPGWKTIQLIVGLGPFYDTVQQMVYIRPFPVASFEWSNKGDSLILINQSEEATHYEWHLDSISFSTETDPSVMIPQGTESPIVVKLIAINGCGSDTIQQYIELTSIDGQTTHSDEWQLHPNPAGDIAHLSGVFGPSEMHLEIIDVQGRICLQYYNPSTEGVRSILLNLRSLPAGQYILRVSQIEKYQVLPLIKE